MSNLPAGPSGNGQTNASGNTTVTPTSQLHTETIVFTGGATARNVIVGTTDVTTGARINILAIFSCDDGAAITVKNANGTRLFTFTKAGGEANALFKIESTGWGGLRAVEQTIPAFPTL